MNAKKQEDLTKIVYGETFNRYSKEEFLEFLEPLRVRLKQNNISADAFRGKRCIDAGCGGGRASILMAELGAAEVISYDLTERNIETTTKHAKLFGFENIIKPKLGSLVEIPFEDQSFDVVWCNGVLHHTIDPTKTLAEVSRILKVGGNFWLYLYGSGGLYWHMVFFFREWLKEVPIETTIAHLAMSGTPTGRIAEFIDDWFVPVLKAYTDADVSSCLKKLGFSEVRRLMGGTTYDTSRRTLLDGEGVWMGGGDLRYWSTKGAHVVGDAAAALPDFLNRGSKYDDDQKVLAFSQDFQRLAEAVAAVEARFPVLKGLGRLSIAGRLQTLLRDLFSQDQKFDPAVFRSAINHEIERVARFG